MVFIDGSNLYHGLKKIIKNTHIDFSKFPQKLCGQRKLIRAYFYIAPVAREGNEEKYRAQQKFFSALDNISYLTKKLGRLEKRDNTWVEKGVDVQLAVDMLSMAVKNLYDTAILVSGDGDFAGVVEAVKDLGKHVEVAYVSQSYHLKSSCDKFILLNADFLKDCFITTP